MLRVIASLLLGSLVTVVVAWACLCLPTNLVRGDSALTNAQPAAWFVWTMHAPGVQVVISELYDDADRLRNQRNAGVPVRSGPPVANWSRAARVNATAVAGGHAGRADSWPLVTETASGWPFPALRSALGSSTAPGSSPAIERGYLVRVLCTRFGREVERAVLPTTPIWPGFLGNSALYAAHLFPLVSARHWRRRRRAKRGLCPQCAYPVNCVDRCPECGTSR